MLSIVETELLCLCSLKEVISGFSDASDSDVSTVQAETDATHWSMEIHPESCEHICDKII